MAERVPIIPRVFLVSQHVRINLSVCINQSIMFMSEIINLTHATHLSRRGFGFHMYATIIN